MTKTYPTSSLAQSVRDLKTWDDTRDSFPAEHWLVAGAGLAVLVASMRCRSPLQRAAGAALGGALLLRAASGRDGLVKLLDHLPENKGLLR